MQKKKRDSIFLEPYKLFDMVLQSFLLVGQMIVSSFKLSKLENKKQGDLEEHKEAYKALQQEIETEEFKRNWNQFCVRGLLIEAILLSITVLHFLYGNWAIAAQLLVVLLGSIVFFGYKPWIIRNKKVVSFIVYLKQGLLEDPQALLLWKSMETK